jgi:hypothetical protein
VSAFDAITPFLSDAHPAFFLLTPRELSRSFIGIFTPLFYRPIFTWPSKEEPEKKSP